MQQTLAPETEEWLDAQVEGGHFPTREAAIDYSVKLTSLRETLIASLADPRRYTVEEVRSSLAAHFERRRGGYRMIKDADCAIG